MTDLHLDFSISEDRTTILVVDDNLDEISELVDVIDGLGHHVKGVESVKSALHVIENDRSVKIVITDIKMDGLDGFDLLAEIDARYGVTRPFTKIIVSGYEEYDYALEAMRLGAVDVIKKPCSANALKIAIRRALVRQGQAAAGLGSWPGAHEDNGHPEEGSPEYKLKTIKRLIRERHLRDEQIGCRYLAEPAWDILLDLCAAKFANQKVSISSACAASDAPFSTALRYANRLVEDNLAIRSDDPKDKRRNVLELSDLGLKRIEAFLSELGKSN